MTSQDILVAMSPFFAFLAVMTFAWAWNHIRSVKRPTVRAM